MAKTVSVMNFFKSWFSTQKIIKSGKRLDSSKKEEFAIDFNLLYQYFLSDPVIRASVQTDVDNICTEYFFEKEDDSQEAEEEEKRAKDIFYRNNHMEKLRNIAMVMDVFDNSYEEVQTYLSEGEIVFDSFVLSTPSIKIINKQDGEIDYYSQQLDGKEVAKLKPQNIIHYKFNMFGDRQYGLSLLQTVLYSSAIRKFIEKYNGAIFQNHKPRGVWLFPTEMDKTVFDENVDSIIESKNDPQKDIYLRGAEVNYKNFLSQQEVDFMKGYIEARNEIIIGLGVPPIYLGIPEGSNRANAGEQGEAYDRRVRAKQNSIAYKINTDLMPRLGFTKIKFAFTKSSKRDEVKELDIVNKMEGLVTLNEAREELGLPALDPLKFPEAEQIWKKGFNPMAMGEPPQDQPQDQFNKALKSKKKLKLVRTTRKEENLAIKPFKDFYNKVADEIDKKVQTLNALGEFKKAKLSPSEVLAMIEVLFDSSQLARQFSTMAKEQYLQGGLYIASKLQTTFNPNKEEVEFLDRYNLDLVKASSTRELNNIKLALQTGILNNQSVTQIEQAVTKLRDTAITNSETLVRTEFNRANNMGSMTSMKQSGKEVLKYLIVQNDKRTSPICKAEDIKYGSVEKAIPIDQEFYVTVKGKVYSGQSPPFHPNCRTIVAYAFD